MKRVTILTRLSIIVAVLGCCIGFYYTGKFFVALTKQLGATMVTGSDVSKCFGGSLVLWAIIGIVAVTYINSVGQFYKNKIRKKERGNPDWIGIRP